jgi:signal transduction histidine kinase
MLDVRPEPVAIGRLADELARMFQPVAAQRGLDFQLRTASAPEMIETDPTRILQILKNLISNALKFTEQGSVSLEISGANGDVRFAVRDTGIGIPEDQHELIFEAFRQADGASTRKFGGTGLGLSISRDLSHLLGPPGRSRRWRRGPAPRRRWPSQRTRRGPGWPPGRRRSPTIASAWRRRRAPC